MAQQRDFLLWRLFQQLRNWQVVLTPADYDALHQALLAGFGWESLQSLRNLCCALWTKSRNEQEILNKVFDDLVRELEIENWSLPKAVLESSLPESDKTSSDIEKTEPTIKPEKVIKPETPEKEEAESTSPEVKKYQSFPEIPQPSEDVFKRAFILTPRFVINYRDIAQTWRRLKKPKRGGAKIDLDIEATIEQRCRQGVVAPVVLKPRLQNAVRVLLLIDRQGSMTPFHRATDAFCTAIHQSANLGNVDTFYFHNVPAEGADEDVLMPLADQLFPTLDTILTKIQPLSTGYVYKDAELLEGLPLIEVLQQYAKQAAVVLLSDGGAARGHYNTLRLLDTVAFLKALSTYTSQVIWLNPLTGQKGEAMDNWKNSTAEQIARHVPMFPLDQTGLHQAMNVLRGQIYPVACPI